MEETSLNEQILSLTLEITGLLTGQRFAAVRSGDLVAILAPLHYFAIPRRTDRQKLQRLINEITDLLTREAGDRSAVKEETEAAGGYSGFQYPEGHKAAMMEDQPMGGSDKRTAIERRLHPPPHPGDSTLAGQEIPHYGQVLDLIKVEMEEEEISGQTLEEMEERWEAEEISQPEPGFRNLLSGGLSLPQEDSDDLTQDSNLHPGPHSTAASRNPQRSSPDVSANQTAAQLLVCPDCSKSFTSKIALKNHRRIHSERRPHSCYECGKSFKQKTHLSSHQMCHARESHFPCPECGARFSTKSQLDVHSRYHSGGPIHVCPECGKEFAARSKLERHRIQHTGNKPFSCHECHYRTAFRSALTIHLRIHTGERPFACATCGQNFREKFLLYRHQRSKKH